MGGFDSKITNQVKTNPQNASDPKTANHHWYPFLRFVEQCANEGKEVSVNEWLISIEKIKDYKKEGLLRKEAAAKAEADS